MSQARNGQSINNERIHLIQTATPADFAAMNIPRNVLSVPLNDLNQTALHLAAKYNPRLIPHLLEQGAKVVKDRKIRTPLYYLLEQMRRIWIEPWLSLHGLFPLADRHPEFQTWFSIGVSLIEKGADPNTRNAYGMNLLHFAVINPLDLSPEVIHKVVVILLELGVMPGSYCTGSLLKDYDALALHYRYMAARHKLNCLLPAAFDTAALLIYYESNDLHCFLPLIASLALQHGQLDRLQEMYSPAFTPETRWRYKRCVEKRRELETSQNALLKSLERRYPIEIADFIAHQHIPRDQVHDADYVFRHVNLSELRLEMQYQQRLDEALSTLHQYFILLLHLINDRRNKDSFSRLKRLPWDLVLMILTINMFKTTRERKFAVLVHDQFDNIMAMLNSPGGIAICKTFRSGNSEYAFFKPAEALARSFKRLPAGTSREEKENYRIHARECLFKQLELLPSYADRVALKERIAGTSLYEHTKI